MLVQITLKVLNSKDSQFFCGAFYHLLVFFWFFKRKKANVRTNRSAKTSSENCILAGSHNILEDPIPLFENFSIEDDRQSVALMFQCISFKTFSSQKNQIESV